MNAQIILFLIITIRCDELKIRIGLPEFICDKDGGVRDISKDLTTIRLLGKDSQNVKYKFDVNFHTIGNNCYKKHQRCTLLIWKAVRELDQYLKNYPPEKLQTGLIEINNTMFTPGIKYILNVTVISNGKIMEEKQLTLDYVDDAVREKTTKPMASLLLLAPDNSYAYASYVINAEVNMCSNVTSYHFQWEISDSAENTTLLPSKTEELNIPPDTLQGLQTYTIQCNLINGEGAVIAEGQQTVNVLSKGLLLRLPVKRLTTKVGRPVRISAYVRDLDNIDGDIRVSWTCLETTRNEKCDYQSDSSELAVESGFPQVGLYKISLEISKSDFSESDFCTIEVTSNSPIIEIEEIEFPTNPGKAFAIRAMVYELRAACTLEWTSPKQEGYEFLDLDSVPGNVAEMVNVTMKEDLFLNELEEYSNGTVDMRHDLVLPPPTNWAGLKGDAKYLFRLLITCPNPNENLAEINETATITTSSDVIIETNASPVTYPLDVTPPEGDAFLTTFNFKTKKAEDHDGPILYKFGYILESRDVVLWNLGEVSNCEATLPYSDDGIQTFVEICDAFGSCGRVLGPVIKTQLSDKIDKEVILKRFVSRMNSEDYSKAFIEAFTALHSYKSQDGATRDFISQKIIEEIGKYLTEDNSDVYNADNLMRNINEFNPQLKLPDTVLNKVVELRNKFSDGSDKEGYSQRKLLSLRAKRASSLTLGEVRTYLEISELIITTSNDPNKIKLEKENLRKQLRTYMEKLCSNMKKPQLSLELKTVIFSVEKLKKTSLNNYISVPFDGNSWQTSARIKLGNVVKDTRDKCVGKAIFRDYFDKIGITYFTEVLNSTDVNDAGEIVIFLPKNKSMEGEPNCVVYYNNDWHSECKLTQNIANYVKCSCKHLGYYYLEYSTVTTSTEMTTTQKITTTEEIVTSINDSAAQIYEGNGTTGNYDSVSYVVIVASVIGIIVLAVTIRKIFHDDDDQEESEKFDFPKYALLHNEEFLNDAHM